MGLLSRPEPLASLQARFPEAVRDWIDAEGVHLGTVWPPCEQRGHVFDFEDGLRLIVHREVDPQGLRLVVLAALVMDGTPFASRLPMFPTALLKGGTLQARINLTVLYDSVIIEA